MQAHSVFLQAAGMAAKTVHALTECPETPELTARQAALVTFAEKLTRSPQSVTAADTDALRGVLPDEGDVIEAANVVAGFNFANRVADALDVPCEVPTQFQRHRFTKHLVMSAMSWAIRKRMRLTNRMIGATEPDRVLRDLDDAVRRAGMGRLPSYFQRLRLRPHILEGQAAICSSLLRDTGFPRATVLRISYVISSLNRDDESAQESAYLLTGMRITLQPLDAIVAGQPTNGGLPALLHDALWFVRDVTLHAEQTTDAQVHGLRDHGLTDVQVLNLVLLAASCNARNRLNRALA